MTFSRPIVPGFRQKNLDGCYRVGQWIVIPEERRIQKEGRVVGMASNIIDALVCLIEAKGEFVSSPRLNDVLWPEAMSSDADVESYMSALQGTLEGVRSRKPTWREIRSADIDCW
jgi:DNA-binding winged helix-turn-helix (wHTH) protein